MSGKLLRLKEMMNGAKVLGAQKIPKKKSGEFLRRSSEGKNNFREKSATFFAPPHERCGEKNCRRADKIASNKIAEISMNRGDFALREDTTAALRGKVSPHASQSFSKRCREICQREKMNRCKNFASAITGTKLFPWSSRTPMCYLGCPYLHAGVERIFECERFFWGWFWAP